MQDMTWGDQPRHRYTPFDEKIADALRDVADVLRVLALGIFAPDILQKTERDLTGRPMNELH